jgi:hypothetical protein
MNFKMRKELYQYFTQTILFLLTFGIFANFTATVEAQPVFVPWEEEVFQEVGREYGQDAEKRIRTI